MSAVSTPFTPFDRNDLIPEGFRARPGSFHANGADKFSIDTTPLRRTGTNGFVYTPAATDPSALTDPSSVIDLTGDTPRELVDLTGSDTPPTEPETVRSDDDIMNETINETDLEAAFNLRTMSNAWARQEEADRALEEDIEKLEEVMENVMSTAHGIATRIASLKRRLRRRI
jgi:hypothetical protein